MLTTQLTNWPHQGRATKNSRPFCHLAIPDFTHGGGNRLPLSADEPVGRRARRMPSPLTW